MSIDITRPLPEVASGDAIDVVDFTFKSKSISLEISLK